MKRFLIVLFLFVLGVDSFKANPVDLKVAETVACKFAEAKFAMERQSNAVQLVYTGPEEAFYVFNIADRGFVIIAADDAYRPVIGYSNESTFDADNIPPALVDYLDGIAMSINRLRKRADAMATPLVAAEWQSVLTKGELISRIGGKGVDYLVQTKWDQNSPYNCCCPEDPNGPGGHTYVGCLATAMAQLMRFWAMPVHGNGSHCYVHEDYGQICADFENTYYDWDHMPNKLNNNSSDVEKLAVGTLGFHCGVTIDMGYGPDGSGGASGPIPGVMHEYFDYSEANVQYRRDDFETETWKRMVREQFDMGWPMYYGGCEDGGCHAFVCDGYDDKDMFHFNLGWGGSSDAWYLIDEAPYTHPADAMFNFVPSAIYDITPSAPTNLSVEVPVETELHAVLQWTNPNTSLNNEPLTSIEEVVVMRDNQIIQVLTGMAPGETVTIDDNDIPYYDNYEYAVYVKANGRYGKHAYVLDVVVGPSCPWKVVMTSTNYHGWDGGYITIYNNAGHVMANCTMDSSNPVVFQPALPLGRLSFAWTAPEEPVGDMGFTIKDSEGNAVYSFSGSSDELTPGVFFEANNGCGNDATCDVPENVVATDNVEGPIVLRWDAVGGNVYGYNVYRDEVLFRFVQSGTEFVDEQAVLGGHCYQVTALCESGESDLSNTTCATEGPCYPPRNFGFEILPNNKIKLKWEAPVETDGLTVYYIYRKKDDGPYQRLKLVSPADITTNDNAPHTVGSDYYYRLLANYDDLDCFSAPANVLNEPNVFDLHIHIFPTEVDEENSGLTIAPNPTDGTVVITGVDLREVHVYNIVGQPVVCRKTEGDTLSIDLGGLSSGVYYVQVVDGNGACSVRKLLKQ